jgi:tetratricopeptide (TPR) repeat protein
MKRSAQLVGLILAIVTYLASPVSAQSVQQGVALLNEGRELADKAHSKEDKEKAMTKFQQALEIFHKNKSEKNEANALYRLGSVYSDLSHYGKALEYYGQALEVYRKIEDAQGEGVALNDIGFVHNEMSQYRKALDYYEKSLQIRRKTGNLAGEATTLNNMAAVYDNMSQYQRALEHYEKALEIRRKTNDVRGEGLILGNIGLVYNNLSQYHKALEYYQKALEIKVKTGDVKGQGTVLNNIGLAYDNLGEYKRALEQYEKALEISKKIGSLSGEGVTLSNIGAVYDSLGQYEKALEFYEQALAIRRKVRDVSGESATLNNIGMTYDNLGRYQQALKYYEQSLNIKRKIGDVSGEGSTLSNIGVVYDNLGQYRKALEYHEQSLSIRRKIGDISGEGTTLNNIGAVYRQLGQYRKALEYYEQSLPIHRKIGNVQMEGTTLSNIGVVYDNLGQYKKALEHYEQALGIRRKIGDIGGEGSTLNNIGLTQQNLGQYQKSMEYFESSLDIKRRIGDISGEGVTLNNIGLGYDYLGQYQKSLQYYEQSLNIQHRIGDISGEGTTLANMGGVYKELGQYSKALEYYEKSLSIRRKIGDIHGEGSTLAGVGAIYNQTGKYDEALQSFQQSLEIYRKLGISTDSPKDLIGNFYLDRGEPDKAAPFIKEAGYYDSLGRMYLLKSDYTNATTQYEKLLAKAQENKNANNLFTAYTGLGKAHEALEDYKKAEEYYEKGMKLTEELRSGLLPSERRDFFERKVNGFERSEPAKGLTRVRMKLNRASGSIDSSEFTRARAFSDNISLRSDAGYAGVPQEILRKEDELVSKVAALKKELTKTDRERAPAKYDNLAKSAQEAEADLKIFVDELWDKYRPYASVKYARPVTLKESALKPEEYVVIFDTSGEGVGVKLVKGKRIVETYYREWKLESLEKDVRKFRQSFEDVKPKEFDPDLGQALYNGLLARVLLDVPKGAPLLIIPDGPLAALPFEALVVAGKAVWKEGNAGPYPEGLTYLGDVYPISYYQSITALSLARTLGSNERPPSKTLVIADPVFDTADPRLKTASIEERTKMLAALPDTLMSIKNQTGISFSRLSQTSELADNLKRISPGNTDLFTGLQATKSILFDKPLTDYGSIVFATHGYFGKDMPGIQEPVLAMTLVGLPKDQDGFLRMTEVMGMKLNANVVALTACQTGLGSNLAGEGVMSMGRAFQYAGARSILMSLWSVSESGSVMLVEKFFERLNAGKNKLEALRVAREDVRKAGYEHPFYWAPFILVGEVD